MMSIIKTSIFKILQSKLNYNIIISEIIIKCTFFTLIICFSFVNQDLLIQPFTPHKKIFFMFCRGLQCILQAITDWQMIDNHATKAYALIYLYEKMKKIDDIVLRNDILSKSHRAYF